MVGPGNFWVLVIDCYKTFISRWLGLTDMGREGDWIWIHSSQVEQRKS